MDQQSKLKFRFKSIFKKKC